MANKRWRLVVKRKVVGNTMHVFNGEWQDRAGARRDASIVKSMLQEGDYMFLQTAETVYCVDDAEEPKDKWDKYRSDPQFPDGRPIPEDHHSHPRNFGS